MGLSGLGAGLVILVAGSWSRRLLLDHNHITKKKKKKKKKKVIMGYGELELHELEISGPECI